MGIPGCARCVNGSMGLGLLPRLRTVLACDAPSTGCAPLPPSNTDHPGQVPDAFGGPPLGQSLTPLVVRCWDTHLCVKFHFCLTYNTASTPTVPLSSSSGAISISRVCSARPSWPALSSCPPPFPLRGVLCTAKKL